MPAMWWANAAHILHHRCCGNRKKILDHVSVKSTLLKISRTHSPPLRDVFNMAEPADYFDDGADCDLEQHSPI
jgi:hypothetical protein